MRLIRRSGRAESFCFETYTCRSMLWRELEYSSSWSRLQHECSRSWSRLQGESLAWPDEIQIHEFMMIAIGPPKE